tara:strand:+ start:1480 stop:1683 length:204 start_codon:yes stop_codon:yes gene_type:complete
MYGHLQKNKITKYDLQQLMLKHRVSINELFLKTGIPVNKIKGYLTGRRAIPDDLSDRIKQIGENNGR